MFLVHRASIVNPSNRIFIICVFSFEKVKFFEIVKNLFGAGKSKLDDY